MILFDVVQKLCGGFGGRAKVGFSGPYATFGCDSLIVWCFWAKVTGCFSDLYATFGRGPPIAPRSIERSPSIWKEGKIRDA